ncbi:MAG: DEAD/DEAH box helicase family protein [Thermosipho sp. (in: Bacteria)]|nr:DEAD/DEAH box helicase family protein [Thermosipho sp. (in: thermotogales)]
MLFFKSGENEIVLRPAGYAEDVAGVMRQINTRFNGWQWSFTSDKLPVVLSKLNLSEGVLYPYLTEYIDKSKFKGIKVSLTDTTITMPDNEEFVKTIEDLCSCFEVDKGRTYKTSLIKETEKDNTYSFPPGLLKRVGSFLKLFPGIDIKYRPTRTKPKSYLDFPAIPKHIEQRDYQARISEEAGAVARATLVLPTGAGKTITSSLIIRKLGVRTLFLTYSSILLNQTADTFKFALGVPIGVIGDDKFSIGNITVATIQTIYSKLGVNKESHEELKSKALAYSGKPYPADKTTKEQLLWLLGNTDCLIVDEGHQLGANTIYSVASLSDPYYSFALTATPLREDGRDLMVEAATGPIWRPKYATEEKLIEQGYLLPVRVMMVPFQHREKYKGEYNRNKYIYRQGKKESKEPEEIIGTLLDRMVEERSILLARDTQHALELAEKFNLPCIDTIEDDVEKYKLLYQLAKNKFPAAVISKETYENTLVEADYIIDATKKRIKMGYMPMYNKAIMANFDRNRVIINIARYYRNRFKTLILVRTIAHGNYLSLALNAPFIHGSTKKEEKERVINQIEKGEINLIIASQILEQGVDIPCLELLIDAATRQKVRSILQPVGRIRRPAPGKNYAYAVMIYDSDGGTFERHSRRKYDVMKKNNWDIRVVSPDKF